MIADRFAKGFRRVFNLGLTRPDDPGRYLQYVPLPYLPAGVNITMDNARELAVVWACMDAITKAITSCDWNVYSWGKDRKRTQLHDDSLDYILNVRPNPDMTAIAFKESLMFMALSWGNAYAEIVPDGANRPAELYPLLSDRIVPTRNPSTWALEYHYYQPDGGTVILPADRVFHLRGPSVTGLMGDNMIAKMAKSIALLMALERFASTYFGNNTIVGGVLEYPKTLDDKTYERMMSSWNARFKGPEKANSVALLEGGMKFTQFSVKGSESMMIEARKFQTEEICRFFGVPLHKVQHIDRATFNNIEHLGIEFVRDAITPWALRLEQEANFKLFRGRSAVRKFTKLDTAPLTWGDYKTRMEGHKMGREMGLYSANDILEMEGRNSIGVEGDIRVIPMNMMTYEQVLLQEEKLEKEIEKLDEPPPPVLAPGQPPNAPPEEDTEEEGAAAGEEDTEPEMPMEKARRHSLALITDAVTALFTSALDRYSKRLKAREADLLRQGLRNGKITANLTAERERLRETLLLQETQNAVSLIEKYAKATQPLDASTLVCDAADHVDAGEEPRAAAARLVSALLPAAKELRS